MAKKRGGKREGAGRKPGIASVLAEKSRAYIAERVAKDQKPIVDKAIEQAKEGDPKAREWLYDRAHGKTPQPLTGADGHSPVEVAIVKLSNASTNTDA